MKENHDLTGRCPKCNMQLWAKPIPRHVRFHDLRHTTGTLLLKAGVPFATVQRMLRHTDPRLTTEIYGHLEQTEAHTARVDGETKFQPATVWLKWCGAWCGKLGAPVVRSSIERKNEGPGSVDFSSETRPFNQSGRQDLKP